MSYQETLDRLSADAEAKAQKVLDQLEAGDIDQAAAIALLAAIILVAQKRGAAVAEISFAAQVSAMSGTATVAAGVKAGEQDVVRRVITKTVTTSKTIDETRNRIVRIAKNEPQEIAKQTYGKALERSKKVEGWTRGLDSDPCELCVWWSRDGRVWPKDYPLAHHKGCQCTQVPVLTERVAAVPYSRILKR